MYRGLPGKQTTNNPSKPYESISESEEVFAIGEFIAIDQKSAVSKLLSQIRIKWEEEHDNFKLNRFLL